MVEGANEAFARVCTAYEALQDPNERLKYDTAYGWRQTKHEKRHGVVAITVAHMVNATLVVTCHQCGRVPPFKIKEKVDTRALVRLKEMTQNDHARLFPCEKSEMNDGWKNFQRVLGHFKRQNEQPVTQ